MIYFGTSGFSYDDWVGKYYPEGMPKQEWLTYYSHEFHTCEINSTYYAVIGTASMRAMVEKTGEDFQFSIKANQKMTHQRKDNADIFQAFCRMLEPAVSAGKLGCILAQFPYSFRPVRENRDYLGILREQLGELPVVVEFRNAGWLTDDVFSLLNRLNMGFCCVDEPRLPNLIPPLAVKTSDIGYVRFHGRNSAKWWQHEHAYERYDYSYTSEELYEWLPRIRELGSSTEKTFVFANNHWRGQAVDTIRQLRMMMD